MRILPPPLSVTLPPPSITVLRCVFTTFAVAVILIVTGFGPQLNVMMPPSATARTTAADVQWRITWLGWDVFTARAADGTVAWPAGVPERGSRLAAPCALVVPLVVAPVVVAPVVVAAVAARAGVAASLTPAL